MIKRTDTAEGHPRPSASYVRSTWGKPSQRPRKKMGPCVPLAMRNWHPIRTAPRDGTPVILWVNGHETPPVLPVTAGFWTTDIRGDSFWHIFGDPDGAQRYSDEHVRGWSPLLRGHNM